MAWLPQKYTQCNGSIFLLIQLVIYDPKALSKHLFLSTIFCIRLYSTFFPSDLVNGRTGSGQETSSLEQEEAPFIVVGALVANDADPNEPFIPTNDENDGKKAKPNLLSQARKHLVMGSVHIRNSL